MEYSRKTKLSEERSMILKMNAQDLDQFLRQKELDNPLIRLKGKREELAENRMNDVQRKLAWLEDSDEQNRIFYDEELTDEQERDEWNVAVEEQESLEDFVWSQLSSLAKTPEEQEILFYLANALDERGYFTESAESVKKRFGLNDRAFGKYLRILQSVEPAGIGARSLVECLLLQLDRLPDTDTMERRIVLECLELMGNEDVSAIATRMGISQDETERCLAKIRGLNPKPGSSFSARENLRYLLPDVMVVKFQGYLQVMLNDTAYPQIRISRYYRRLLEEPGISEDARDYIRNQMQEAEGLIRAVELRGEILTAVMRTVVERNRDFFERGPGFRREVTLGEVAVQSGYPQNVVEMAIRDKYIQCTWGIYPANYVLGNPVGRENKAVGSEADHIRGVIREIIEKEDKGHPLSDQKITDLLNGRGVSISRRTVAKYRGMMKIPDAVGRKAQEMRNS